MDRDVITHQDPRGFADEPAELTRTEAWNRVLWPLCKYTAWFIGLSFVGCGLTGFDLFGPNPSAFVVLVAVFIMCGLNVVMFMWMGAPIAVAHERTVFKRDAQLRELKRMNAMMGVETPQGAHLSTRDLFWNIVRDSKSTLVGAAFVEACLAFVLFFPLRELLARPEPDLTALVALTAALGVAPVYVIISLLVRAWRGGGRAEEFARVELAYRHALRDHEQLMGGLVLDEHVGGSGGELTVQAEAGGLEVREQVVLDVDGADEVGVDEVTSRHEVAR